MSKLETALELMRKAEMFQGRPNNPGFSRLLQDALEDAVTWETHPKKLLAVLHYVLLILRDASTQLDDIVLRPLGVEDLFALRDQFYQALGRTLPRLANAYDRPIWQDFEDISEAYRDAVFHVRAAREKRERRLARS